MVESKGSASSQLPGVPVRLYRAVLTHTDIQITVRIWSTTDHDWTWTPLDTWTPDPTPTTPAQLADELHRHGWTTPEDPTTLTKVTVIPENWQALVDHALAARNHQAHQLRVAENILTDILGDAADAGLSVTFLAQAAGLPRAAFYKRSAKTINSMRHADQPREDPSQLTRAEKTALSLGDE
ncbi:hypothetical protein [Cutibacterium modestum]|uniref:hypothetical protein n=1 Tax=Cutibacterium modestum TaxID=2559073 RepID=UPI001ABE953F|nr:hypothetical protein [Cutibacterium modestum]